ncbi:protein PTST homolog 3, chloroplastic isoform X2 [Nicotiana tomentosiformis]|uniref:protein PTST homolog 3, chloroplastic isoform X2 n=1 Tax=Nicotiana tomentosiformis TaxID=4098 RepID=UPI00051BEF33|nr:protein PTST homolog 3, chloroplastic isoform X2 [Nicotiana tomentosiformis]
MATLFHFPKVFFSPLPTSLCCTGHHYLLVYHSKPAICASIKKPSASRKVKSNVDLCNNIREFLSSVGLPEDHVPTMKELSQHGRQDLANIVRRRGYKLLRELLSTSKPPNYEECSGEDGLVEKSEDESLGQDGKMIDMAHDVSLPNEASAVDEYTNDANNDRMLNSDEQNSSDQEPSGYSSLEEKVANFIQNGELDSVEDSSFEIFNERGFEQVVGSVVGQNVVKTESTTPKEHKDFVLCNDNGAEIFNGNSMPPSTQHAEHPSGQSFRMRNNSLSTEDLTMTEGRNSADVEPQKVENQAEIIRLKFMLHQKELELTHLKQQIEEEKCLLSSLQIKAEREISEAQRRISEKDAELNAAEDSLSGLKEVEIQYWADGESVEVAGSFNGWHHKVKMELQASSTIIDPIDQDIQTSSDTIDPIDMRKPRLWKTVLWLYPGIYEIKFVVDGHWTTDPQMESVTRGAIQNNVLRVDR